MSSEVINLYKGENSAQHYWQSADGRYLLAQNKGERFWSAYVDCLLVKDTRITGATSDELPYLVSMKAEALADALAQVTGLSFALKESSPI